MVGLGALPLPARDAVVRYLHVKDALFALPFVSEDTLAALKELRLPLGRMQASTTRAARRQANAPRRAWDLGTLDLSWCLSLTDVWRAARRYTNSTSIIAVI
mmetsp:Transcript_6728/g.21215  ORF Transcript_6728/g.21215 Transcript_6728/m.21215 type:complete len:102 (+) Transcript_6728:375-680(+)